MYAYIAYIHDTGVQWRKPGAEFGGTEKIFADQDQVFPEKMSIFAVKKSDNHFFSHRPSFSNFASLFRIFTLLHVVYDPFLTIKTPFSRFS